MSEHDDLPIPDETPVIVPDPTAVRAAEMVDEGGPVSPEEPIEVDPSTKVAETVEKAREESSPEQGTEGESDEVHLDSYDDIADDSPDVDAALAALGSLNSLAEPESMLPATDAPSRISSLRQPPLSVLERGTTASVVPAVLLIGMGVFLTLLVASGSPLPSASMFIGMVLLAFGLSLLAWWISSGRWARGSLLIGLITVAAGGLAFLA